MHAWSDVICNGEFDKSGLESLSKVAHAAKRKCCRTCVQIDDGRLEESLGFPHFTSGEPRLGWLMNFNAVRCWPCLAQRAGYAANERLRRHSQTTVLIT